MFARASTSTAPATTATLAAASAIQRRELLTRRGLLGLGRCELLQVRLVFEVEDAAVRLRADHGLRLVDLLLAHRIDRGAHLGFRLERLLAHLAAAVIGLPIHLDGHLVL